MQELFSLTSKKAMLETEKSATELADNEEYQRLTDRIEELRSEADQSLEAVTEDDDDFEKLFQEFDTDADVDTDDECRRVTRQHRRRRITTFRATFLV